MAFSKPNLFQTLTLLIAFTALFLSKVHSQQDTTSFTVDTWEPRPSFLTYNGDAQVPPGVTDYLRLTRTDSSGNAQSGSVGRVLYNNPVQFWEQNRQSSFETTIRFVITPPRNNNPADGIVFFIAPLDFPFPQGSNGGNLGIYGPSGNSSGVFAIEFDTYVNGEWDPSYRHIGINLESRRSVSTSPYSYDFLGQEVTLLINYEENTRRISASATVGTERYEVEYFFDLKTILDQQVQVGIAASTGVEVAVHDVHAWYFTSTLLWDGNNVGHKNENKHTYTRQFLKQFV